MVVRVCVKGVEGGKAVAPAGACIRALRLWQSRRAAGLPPHIAACRHLKGNRKLCLSSCAHGRGGSVVRRLSTSFQRGCRAASGACRRRVVPRVTSRATSRAGALRLRAAGMAASHAPASGARAISPCFPADFARFVKMDHVVIFVVCGEVPHASVITPKSRQMKAS